jgi:stage V sporulation protein SpoVS
MDTKHKSSPVPSDDPITQVEDGKTYTNVLRVKADPDNISDEQRKINVKSLAGAIAHTVRRFGEVQIRVIGKDSTYKAIKAIIEARGMVAVHGHDLYMSPGYMIVNNTTGKSEMTGLTFYVITSTSSGKHDLSE